MIFGKCALVEDVVFDSNAYRNFVRGKSRTQYAKELEVVKNIEKCTGIQPVQSVVVLSELFRHLMSPSDINYAECKEAVIASSIHCKKVIGMKKRYSYAPSFESALCLEATGKPLPNQDYEISVSMVADKISENPTDNFIASGDVQGALNINLQNETQNRQNFFLSVVNVIKLIDKKATGFGDFLKDKKERRDFLTFIDSVDFAKMTTLSKLDRIQKFHGVQFTTDDTLLNRMMVKFSPLIQFERKFWKKAANGIGITDSSHKEFNTFYDIMIIFGAIARNPRAIFVTEEKQIHASFAEVGLQSRVMTLNEYLAYIKKKKPNPLAYLCRKIEDVKDKFSS